ncbi:MAG TPA: Fic family protein [Vicinamibacterales bacterium]|nr:Fic family protein [Vicinamibacterales bacterium]HPW21547.1 Fic family protein [Vicinamibacterales bacterium]
MATAQAQRQPHGRSVRCPGGYRAYVPHPLPPRLAWSDGLAATLSRADLAMGRLAGEGRRLPNPHLLIRPFVRREAVLSSRIEGTQATLGEVLAAEAGAAVERSPEDLREVANYVAALEFGVARLAELPLSLRLVRELHERLMRGVRGDAATPGEFRRSQNWIGPPGSTLADASFVPPPPDRLMDCLGAWETFLHDESLPPLVHAALAHSQFEAIHPFLDGNGRVGRLLITLLLVERHVLPSPLLYLSAYFEATRPEYYARLSGVTARGEWEEWLTYFLRGVAGQAEDALGRIQRIDALVAGWRERLAQGSTRVPGRALDLFVENPFWTVNRLAGRLGVAFTTAQRGVDRLEAAGMVALAGQARRNRVYCARALLDILEEPPRLPVAERPRPNRRQL